MLAADDDLRMLPVPAHHLRVGHAQDRAGRGRASSSSSAAASPASSCEPADRRAAGRHRRPARGRHGARRRPRRGHHRPAGRRARRGSTPTASPSPRRSATPVSSTSPASTGPTDEYGFGFRGGFGAGLGVGVIGSDAGTYSITAVVDRNDKELRAHLSDSARFDATMRAAPRAGRRRRRRRHADPPGALHDRAHQPHPLVHRRRRARRSSAGSWPCGDAHTCTNPAYGRGQSLALKQAVMLADAARRARRRARGGPRLRGGAATSRWCPGTTSRS